MSKRVTCDLSRDGYPKACFLHYIYITFCTFAVSFLFLGQTRACFHSEWEVLKYQQQAGSFQINEFKYECRALPTWYQLLCLYVCLCVGRFFFPQLAICGVRETVYLPQCDDGPRKFKMPTVLLTATPTVPFDSTLIFFSLLGNWYSITCRSPDTADHTWHGFTWL